MKIEKIKVDEAKKPTANDHAVSQILYEIVKKINMVIELMSCPNCGNIKGMVGSGLCFSCDSF